jgi:hypothetical protein
MSDPSHVLQPIFRCAICGEVVSPDDPEVLRRVMGYACGAEMIVFERYDEFAHERCLSSPGSFAVVIGMGKPE